MDVSKAICDKSFYTSENKLTSVGCVKFWSEIDHQIKEFDTGKGELKAEELKQSRLECQSLPIPARKDDHNLHNFTHHQTPQGFHTGAHMPPQP